MVRNREKPPAPALRLIGGGRRVQIDLGSSSAPINKRPDNEKQGTVAVTCVDTIIGREYIALRTERYIYDPHISRYELWPYKTGPRKGQFRKVRVWGAYRDRRISVRRYRDAESSRLRVSGDEAHSRYRAVALEKLRSVVDNDGLRPGHGSGREQHARARACRAHEKSWRADRG